MPGPLPGERQLVPEWSYGLIFLSYCISWLGAYTSTQIVIHAKYSRTKTSKWVWYFLASVAFGFTAIWSMHFVGMLACGLDVQITYNIPSTIFSAVIAIMFTFAAFTTADVSEALRHSPFIVRMSKGLSSFYSVAHSMAFGKGQDDDIESGRRPRTPSITDEERRPMLASTSDQGDNDDEDEDEEHARNTYDNAQDGPLSHGPGRNAAFPAHQLNGHPHGHHHRDVQEPLQGTFSMLSLFGATLRAPLNMLFGSRAPTAPDLPEIANTASARTSEDSTPLTTDSSDDTTSLTRGASESSEHSISTLPTTASSHSWSDPLHAGLSREARLRIKAQARDKPVPTFGWRYWLKQYYSTINILVFVRAAIWGSAIVFMHYCGMWAMEIPEGRVEWDLMVVIFSYIVAFAVCFLGCVAMVHMEVHFGRQVVFSTLAALGVCSMHYTGMGAASFYTKSPPMQNAGYPTFLPFTILALAAFVCVISNAVLAHSAIISRNRMAEVILTKRRLWRIMAEKEAAEQANELKQQFISVASHEIRTPLHAVNGYCELLAMTTLTEEQTAYIASIQQACHAINVIAGNVLDFSKLDRDNVELSARPVLVDLRKMVEDQARIIETRSFTTSHPAVDVIVSVNRDVPEKVYLDETYTYRILMNLLSNAQKFCEEGYICVHVFMDTKDQVAIKISDTGCGIPKSFRQALFQPFRQADSTLTRPRQGTGLGLSIVKHLVERMSGSVDVESVEGEGSTFIVKLPVTVPTQSPLSRSASLSPKKRLKLVYRHERTARLLVDLWKPLGVAVSLVPHHTSLQDLLKGADAVWTDVESLNRSPALREMIESRLSYKTPPLFIVHTSAHDLQILNQSWADTPGVILVKRPIITHALLDALLNPAAPVQPPASPPRVRFAPTGKTPSEEHKVEIVAENTPPVLEHPQERLKILLVEDNKVNQHLGKRLLERLGYDVETADDGEQAIQLVLKTRFQCCFMDCQMPVLDGFGATAKIRELEHSGTIQGRLPIIALTANVSAESEEKCRASGMDYFLPKPFKMTDLRATLTHVQGATTSSY
ncbi:hypothetical protein BDW22DRAFT_64594 [Trametopsis cervina]|nr:hypothetical protein BDW22DRAFT_64594 [Trametopsis cervina]